MYNIEHILSSFLTLSGLSKITLNFPWKMLINMLIFIGKYQSSLEHCSF